MKHLIPLLAAALLLSGCGPEGRADNPSAARADNPALNAMFNADQKARQDNHLDLLESMADAERLAEAKAMLDRGEIRSGVDYFRAAFIFHHSREADDILKAHVLATAALAQGHQDAAWIAAASLDRYLQATERPQIYGTQFVQTGAETTRGAFDPDFMPDSLRRDTRVPPLAEQQPSPQTR
ncbi:hypothetical protein [Brevundimonas sp.]|uniref:hypothetical protein n=1 Tax=Brevundimonas sp. TaxID=1871086 RepID=UPI0028989E31|nr:hypothetical protein [Brevundimonas sp.]